MEREGIEVAKVQILLSGYVSERIPKIFKH